MKFTADVILSSCWRHEMLVFDLFNILQLRDQVPNFIGCHILSREYL